MRAILFPVFLSWLLALSAVAQVSVQVRTAKDSFLVYEAIPVVVTIHNPTGRTIELKNTLERSWLRFLVTDEANRIVPATGALDETESMLVPPGQSVSATVDLLPLYELRQRGMYRVQANVDYSGRAVSSPVAHFSLLNGRELWSQTVGLPGTAAGQDDLRVYSLVARREGAESYLYVWVREEPSRAIYSLIPLGIFMESYTVQAKTDGEASLHVLYQNGPRSYGYVEISPWAKVTQRAAYSDMLSRPVLVSQAGEVTVVGGEKSNPKSERILTPEELAPPSVPAKPKPKKKWWWPFGPKHVPGEDY